MSRSLHTMKVGNQTVVAGLIWRDTPGDDPAAVREQVRAAAAGARSRFGVRLESVAGSQVGFLPETAPSTARSKPSAAAYLALTHPTPIFYIEEMPDGRYWILRTAEGYVDPRTDVLMEAGDTGRFLDDLLEQISASGDEMPELYVVGDAPASNMLSRHEGGVKHHTFSSLVEGIPAPKRALIKQLIGVTPATYLGALAAMIGLALIYGGYLAYEKYQADLQFERDRAELAARDMEALRLQNETELRMRVAVESAAKEDTATVSPTELIASCADHLDRLGTRMGGWAITSVECEGNGTAATVRLEAPKNNAQVGTAATLLHIAESKSLPVAFTPENGTASVALPQPAMIAREGLMRAAMPGYANLIRGLLSRLQMGNAAIESMTYQLATPTARAATYVDPAMDTSSDVAKFKQVPPEQSYRKGTLSLRGTGRWSLDAISLEYPFITITKLELRPGPAGAMTWQLEAHYVTNG